MIKIKIERLDEPEVMTYTNTGLPKHIAVLEQYEPSADYINCFILTLEK